MSDRMRLLYAAIQLAAVALGIWGAVELAAWAGRP